MTLSPRLNDLELMELRMAALFTNDAEGHIVMNNEPEPDPDPAPRLFVGRTREGVVWRLRHDLPAAVVDELERLLAKEPPLTDPRPPPASLAALCEALSAHAPAGEIGQGPAWRFPETHAMVEGAVPLGPQDAWSLREHFPYTAVHLGVRQPCAAVLVEDVAVSICYSARISPRVAEAGVDTIEGFRGRGYAGRVTVAWADLIRRGGRLPLYSTSWDNLASQAVAPKLGLVLYGVDLWVA